MKPKPWLSAGGFENVPDEGREKLRHELAADKFEQELTVTESKFVTSNKKVLQPFDKKYHVLAGMHSVDDFDLYVARLIKKYEYYLLHSESEILVGLPVIYQKAHILNHIKHLRVISFMMELAELIAHCPNLTREMRSACRVMLNEQIEKIILALSISPQAEGSNYDFFLDRLSGRICVPTKKNQNQALKDLVRLV